MMRSMYSGVSGLRIHQTKMDVIGNNIANVNTAGFKASRVTFRDVFSQTIQGASGANENVGGTNPMQIGLGASIASVDVLMTEGAAQRTDNPLDLKIEGEGFFVVSDATGNKFTRAGAFKIDDLGNLVNYDGLKVMGWYPDPTTGEIEKARVKPLQILNGENAYVKPTKTENITLSGNIDKTDTQLATAAGSPFTFDFYDNLGYKYTAEVTVRRPDPALNNFSFTMGSITDANGTVLAGVTGGPVTLIFDDATGKLTTASPTGFSLTFPNPNLFADPLEIDASDLTMFSGKTTVTGLRGDKDGVGAGNFAGSIDGYEIGPDGKILGQYTNGETKLLGQIAVAIFENPAGLQKIGSNLFITSSNSGDFDGVGLDITSTGGNFNAGVLEMSNVDLSSEFTEMITTQRGFQANSRIITSSDEMLQELVNLKR